MVQSRPGSRPTWMLVCFVLAMLGFFTEAAQADLTRSIAGAKAAGKPLLIIGTSPSPYSERLMKIIKSPAIRPLVARFVPHVLHLGNAAEVKQYRTIFKVTRTSSPMMVIYSPNGKLVDETYTSFHDVKIVGTFLKNALNNMAFAGTDPFAGVGDDPKAKQPRPQAKDVPVEEPDNSLLALREARKHIRQGKIELAIAALAPQVSANGPSAPRIKAMVADIEEHANQQIKTARAKLSTDGKQLLGALSLVKLHRLYAPLPSVNERFEQLREELGQDDLYAKLLEQADAIDEGRVLEADGRAADAVGVYQQVAEDYPDSQAAKLVKRRIEQLDGK